MQVQATNTVDYASATKDAKKTNKVETTSDVKFDMSKPFDEIIADYTKRKDEQNATLDAYTRNTKQNPVVG